MVTIDQVESETATPDLNTSALKKFAQAARRGLREQVGGKLTRVLAQGSLARRESEKAVAELEGQIAASSRDQVIERVAYTWFNRFCALRFMDVNRYTRIGTVSPAEGYTQPEILMDAKQGVIDDEWNVDKRQVLGLLDGSLPSDDPQQEAYRILLVAVCNRYHSLMPFLFEKIADYTELLIPDDLLSDNSVLTQARNALAPESCRDVEVIGWLYQFYISEKKDEVFAALKKGKKITPENIPAATQLFTPHWIVRYLVENSLGRLWMLNHPDSRLIEQMDYYIRPEEPETDFLRISSPEEIKICDPACGSGHMLTYAFDLLYEIYEEQGYQATDIPRLILTHNLYGIEIDQRAGALAAFALTMKAREKYRRFLQSGKVVQPNICVLENIQIDPEDLSAYMDKVGRDLFTGGLQGVVNQWEEADNFGSLIRPLVTDVSEVLELLRVLSMGEDLFLAGVHQKVLKALRQADYLSPKYHVVVANPPYTGFKNMNPSLKAFAESNYEDSSSDLYAMFIERLIDIAPAGCSVSMVTMDSWMYGDEYNEFRQNLLERNRILSLLHLGPRAFDEISGEVVQVAAFVIQTTPNAAAEGVFVDLVEHSNSTQKQIAFAEGHHRTTRSTDWFSVFPRKVLMGYRATNETREAFVSGNPLQHYAEAFTGLQTGDNPLFIKYWFEPSMSAIAFGCKTREAAQETGKKWFPYIKGSEYRKWYGNQFAIVDWKNDGKEIREHRSSTVRNSDYYFHNGLAYNNISRDFCARYVECGFIFDQKNSMFFSNSDSDLLFALGFLHSTVITPFLKILSPKDFNPGSLKVIPVRQEVADAFTPEGTISRLIEITRHDWNRSEISWDFTSHELQNGDVQGSLESRYRELRNNWRSECDEVFALEQRNDQFFIREYGLQDEIDSSVSINAVTLFVNSACRYDADKSESELEALLLADTMREFISYAVGCMLGRYSLDVPGLVLANAGESIEDYYRIVMEKRVASGEGRGASKEQSDECKQLQGSDRLAEGDGSGPDGLSSDETVSEGRALWADESGSSSGGVSSVEHRRGTGEELDGGVSQLPLDSEGISGGGGNATSDSLATQLHNEGKTNPNAESTDRSQQDDQCSDENSSHSPLTTSHSVRFQPDADNVIPLLDGDWFTDDISERFKEFLKVTFGTEHYEENLTFLENALYPDNLTGKKRKTIRDYFLKEFYNHHIKLYKKRPIYWLFSSPKGTFNALIYMHRYRPDTVSVVLGYLRDFNAKLTAEVDNLQTVADSADAAQTARARALKQITSVKKDIKELNDYEHDVLYPLATQQVEIDLDDGVKVNYNKFGKALKKVTGISGK